MLLNDCENIQWLMLVLSRWDQYQCVAARCSAWLCRLIACRSSLTGYRDMQECTTEAYQMYTKVNSVQYEQPQTYSVRMWRLDSP